MTETLKTKNDSMQIPATLIPEFRTQLAIQNKVERNLLFKTWGGIGDQICAEPTLRYVFKAFKDCSISLASWQPELFRHLPFKKVYDLKDSQPYWDKYFVFDTICNPSDITWQFMSHCLVNCVDFPSLCALRMQLPIQDKEIILRPWSERFIPIKPRSVFIHPGKHWPSKTFPVDWWNDVIALLKSRGLTPVIIGADTSDNRTTVDVYTEGCLDLRNKTTLQETVQLLQQATVLITNDSSPLHMAASRDPNDSRTGKCWIGYVATCKRPDFITHWRTNESGKLEWQWREVNLGKGGIWDLIDNCPNKESQITVDLVEEEILRSWLPEPITVVDWAESKFEQFGLGV